MTAPAWAFRRSPGFALPIVIFTVAIFALSAFTLAESVNGYATQLRRAKEQAEFERRAAIVEARLAYLALSEPMSARSIAVGGDRAAPFDAPPVGRSGAPRLREVMLDGAWYGIDIEGQRFEASLQDEAGLPNINGRSPERLARSLQGAGATPDAARLLADRIVDFTDGDDVRRPRGAERREYQRAALEPPPNAPLGDIREAEGVLGWSEFLAPKARAAAVAALRAAPADASFNVNTARGPALAAAFGIDERTVETVLRRRNGVIIRNTDDLAAIAGGGFQLDEIRIAATPARAIRLVVREARVGGRVRREQTSSLVLAKPGDEAPIGFGRRSVRRNADIRSEDERAEPLPGGADLLAR
ncbi:MAG: hypothetical protein ACOYM8_07140 [Caulobacterales bacterium]|jgi:type II secretory pathway component PulK